MSGVKINPTSVMMVVVLLIMCARSVVSNAETECCKQCQVGCCGDWPPSIPCFVACTRDCPYCDATCCFKWPPCRLSKNLTHGILHIVTFWFMIGRDLLNLCMYNAHKFVYVQNKREKPRRWWLENPSIKETWRVFCIVFWSLWTVVKESPYILQTGF